MTNPKREPIVPGTIESYPVLPLRDIVVFPHMIVPLFVGREKSIRALEEVMKADRLILLATQMNAADDDPAVDTIFKAGTLASVLQLLKLPDGTVKVLVEGQSRAKVQRYTRTDDFYEADAEALADDHADKVEVEALARSVVSEFEGYVKLNKKISPEVVAAVTQIDDYAKLADTVASHLAVKIADKQAMLETTSVTQRLENCLSLMESEISVLQVEKRIRTRVKRQMEKTQREYYLNEQMKAIQKELGDEDGKDDLAELEERIKTVKLSKEARDKASAELKKLRQMSPMSAEATVVRNYLDWLLSIPWNKRSKVKKDLNIAEDVLDSEHFGLDKVKERIIEYLAVQSRANKLTGPILCLVGPPGVGKTSLGKSIAKATGREFVRMSLGGVRDEAEIRGHRRTYIGSMPGKIIQSMRKAKTSNPLFLLDEIDKMGMDFRGDPSSALLEVLDPEQNQSFSDHYLEVELRPVERDVRDDGEHPEHPGALDGPHGDHPHRRLYRAGEARDRPASPHPDGPAEARAERGRVVDRRQRPDGVDPPLYAGSGCPQPRARIVEPRAQGGEADPDGQGEDDRRDRNQRVRFPGRAEVSLRSGRTRGSDRRGDGLGVDRGRRRIADDRRRHDAR